MEELNNGFIIFLSLLFGFAVFAVFSGLTAIRGQFNLLHSLLVSLILAFVGFVFLELKSFG